MITLNNVTKQFDEITALQNVNLTFGEGQICGLLGTNGAGKSTLMRLICGIDTCDVGTIMIDEEAVYDNIAAKEKVYFCSDNPFYFSHGNGKDMATYLGEIYEGFRMDLFLKWMDIFKLDPKRRIGTYSKGKKKLMSILLGLATQTKYLICDETFDGLDPTMRQAVKTLLIGEMDERGLTVLVSSHNLRELEDLCDDVVLLHEGNILISEALDEMKEHVCKVQCVFAEGYDISQVQSKVKITQIQKRDTMYSFVAHSPRKELEEVFAQCKTVYLEIFPLTLEEIFIMETEVAGYDVKKVLLETM